MPRKPEALVTGAAGFLGSHLCDKLLSMGWKVHGVDNILTGDMENLESASKNSRFGFEIGDIEDHNSSGWDYVFHLASPASPEDYARYPLETLSVGSEGTRRALDIADKSDAVFLLASTSEVYGDPKVSPQPETYWGNVNPIGPRSCYDEAKRFSEALAIAYAGTNNTKVRIARIFNTYGPRMRYNDGRAIPNFATQAISGQPITVYGDGKQTRSLTYVSDLVDGIVKLAMSDVDGPVNLGNPRELPLIEIAQKVKEAVGSSSSISFRPLPQDDPKHRRPDITRARKLLKWEPKISLESGLVPTIKYFRGALAAA